jgi:hypothetical protein
MANAEFVRYTRAHVTKMLRDAQNAGRQQGRLEAMSTEALRFGDEHLKGTMTRLQIMAKSFSGEARKTVTDALLLLTAQRLTIQTNETVVKFAQEQFERVKTERDGAERLRIEAVNHATETARRNSELETELAQYRQKP